MTLQTVNQSRLIFSSYQMYREDESLDFLSNSLLYEICKQWIVQDSKLSFEDFLEYSLDTEEDDYDID